MKGFCTLWEHVTILDGACFSSKLSKVHLKRARYSWRLEEEESTERAEDLMSSEKATGSMEDTFLTNLVILGGLILQGIEIAAFMEKWSERQGFWMESSETRDEVERVIKRSRVWLDIWVGDEICWTRSKELSKVRKREATWSEEESTWILKSPERRNSQGEDEKEERRFENSSKNKLAELEGGR